MFYIRHLSAWQFAAYSLTVWQLPLPIRNLSTGLAFRHRVADTESLTLTWQVAPEHVIMGAEGATAPPWKGRLTGVEGTPNKIAKWSTPFQQKKKIYGMYSL